MKNNNKKYKQLGIVLIPIILLVIVLSISYAYWRKTSTQSNLNRVDILNCLSTTLTEETSAISLTDEFPITNEEGMQKEPYTFKITNNCDSYVYADIALEVLSLSTLQAQYVRGSVNNNGDTTDNSNKLTNFQSGVPTISGATSHILKKESIIPANDSATFDLRIWVDYDTTLDQGFDKTFESKIVVAYSPAPLPVHLVVNIPSNPKGIYSTAFSGAEWNHKTSTLDISSLNSPNSNIELTNVNTEEAVNLASYLISLAGTDQGTGKLVNENGYRYEGKSPNNWIIFNGEYWRIIGVFDDATHGRTGENLVKLIREDSLGGLAWDKNNTNDWSLASLKNLLNDNYYNGTNEVTITNCYAFSTSLPGNCNLVKDGITKESYRNMIETVTWKLGGHSTNNATTDTFYTAERGTTVYSGRPTSYEGKVGLMYPSDYGYSVLATSCARSTNLSAYNTATCGGQSWLAGKGFEWALTPYSSYADRVFNLRYDGYLASEYANDGFAGRPSIYLKSDTLKLGGNGTYENPYIIVG